MLATIVLPFVDLRPLADPAFIGLTKPNWPSPVVGHMRGIGGARPRFRPGFPDWLGEAGLVAGLPGMRLRLPRTIAAAGQREIALVRKACHFDGMLNGRFEVLLRVTPDVGDVQGAKAVARALLETPAIFPRYDPEEMRPLRSAAPIAAWLWGRARVKRSDAKPRNVCAGRAFVILENGTPLGPIADDVSAGARLIMLDTPQPSELFLIYPRADAALGRQSAFHAAGRTIRTYMLRLLQDVETIAQLCAMPSDVLDSDMAQQFLNEYTRHVARSARVLTDDVPDTLVDYCYAAFARLQPGKVEGLRARIAASPMRPNVRAKLLDLLDASVAAAKALINIEHYHEGDQVMGDKFQDIQVSGSQGVAFGRGAKATVSGSINQQGLDPELIKGLKDLAKTVRESGQPGAAVEAEVIEAAATKAEAGDEDGVMAYLGKAAKWTFDLAAKIGSTALTAFLSAKFGLS